MFNVVLVAVATLFGVFLRYLEGSVAILLALAAALVVAWATCRGAAALVRTRPFTATLLFQAWYVVPLALIIFTTFFATWLAIELPGVFADVDEAEQDIVTGVILGAVNALFASAWLDNAKDPNSRLWPDQRHKSALAAAFSGAAAPPPDSELFYAALMDATRDNAVKGWSFSARWARARILATHHASRP